MNSIELEGELSCQFYYDGYPPEGYVPVIKMGRKCLWELIASALGLQIDSSDDNSDQHGGGDLVEAGRFRITVERLPERSLEP